MSKILRELASIFVFLCCITVTFAFQISEIQYDPSGSDTDREWIEVFNESTESLDLTQYKFFENNTNHSIDVLSGDKVVLSGEYVVIVQNMDKFKTDYPNYTGKIFKSSFSLSNSGEVLSLKDKSGTVLHTIDYTSSASTAGNGFTLNFNGSGLEKGSTTPGSGSLQVGQGTTNTTGTSTSTTTTQTTASTTLDADGNFIPPVYYHRSYFPESEKIYLSLGENRIALAGSDILFEVSSVMGDTRRPVNANYFWDFGDGESAEGVKVYHAYKFSGEYTVNVEAFSNGSKSSDRIYVKVMDPNLSISLKEINGEKGVQVLNNGKDEVDIGGFLVRATGGEFVTTSKISKHLNLMPKKGVVISQDTLKFATSSTHFELLYSNGKQIAMYDKKSNVSITNTYPKLVVVSTSSVSAGTLVSVALPGMEIKVPVATKTVAIAKSKPKKIVQALKKVELAMNVEPEREVTNSFTIEKKSGLLDSVLSLFHK